MAGTPHNSPEHYRQVSLSYAMEQARLPDYNAATTAVELIANANDFYEFLTNGTVPGHGDK